MRTWLALFVAFVAALAAVPALAQGVTDAEVVLGGSNSFSGPLAFSGEQSTRYGVPPFVAGNGLRPFCASHSCRHACAGG